MDILLLTGSARPDGNSAAMAEAFTRGARSAGHRVERFDAARHAVGGCSVCNCCFSGGTACPADGEFSALAESLMAADAVVFASPLYWLGFPARLKAVIDKFYAFRTGGRSLAGKCCALMVCAEAPQGEIFDAVRLVYGDMAAYLGWTDRGVLAVPGMREKGLIAQTDALARAEALGRSI